MTTTLEASTAPHPALAIDTPCPAYCTMPPGHPVDNITNDGKGSFRIHAGLTFGDFLQVYAEEYVTEPGVLYIGIDLVAEPDCPEGDTLSATDLRRLAIRCEIAASWLETRLAEPNTFPAVAR